MFNRQLGSIFNFARRLFPFLCLLGGYSLLRTIVLVNNDTNFWIDLVSPDGLKPRELPSDGRDMLVIEIQLLTQPHTSRF